MSKYKKRHIAKKIVKELESEKYEHEQDDYIDEWTYRDSLYYLMKLMESNND